MTRRGGRLLAGAAGLALLVSVFGGVPVATGTEAADDALALADSFAACTQQQGAADVILLLDQSLSLKDSDPKLVRRAASRDLVQQLEGYATAAHVDLNIQVAGFDGVYHEGPWHPLDAGTLGQVLGEVDEATDNEGLGPATDYWMALDGARAQFAQTAGSGSPCRMLVWFSDGQYDVDENGSFGRTLPYAPDVTLNDDTKDEVIQAGKDSICSAKQGPMNPMRVTGVYVATVGLNTLNPDLDFLKQATDGSNNCGRTPLPDHAAYLEAEEAGALTLAIAGLSGGELSEGEYDGRDAALPFGLDDAVATASVLAYAGPSEPGTEFGLSGPDGQVVWWRSGSPAEQLVAGASVSFEPVTDQSGRFTIIRPQGGTNWVGTWTAHMRVPQPLPPETKAQMVVTVTGDLTPTWTNPVIDGEAGGTLPVSIELVSGSGEIYTRDHPGIRVAIEYADSQGRVTSLKSDLRVPDLATPQEVTLPAAPGDGKLTLRLDLTTDAQPPTKVVPTVSAYPMRLIVPGDYPSVGAARFPSVVGMDPSTGTIEVTGPGCVYVDVGTSTDGVKTVPDGVDVVTVGSPASSAATCLALEPDQTAQLEVSLAPSAQGNGSIVGDLTVVAHPAGAGADQVLQIPYLAERTKAADEPTRWITLILVTLLGLLLGALPLMVVRARLARINVRPGRYPLQAATTSFRIRDGAVVGADGGAFSIAPNDIQPAGSSGGATHRRRLDLEGVAVAAQAFGNPFSMPRCRVTRAGAPLTTSLSTASTLADSGELPLALPGHWVAWPRPDGSFGAIAFLGIDDAMDSQLPMTAGDLAQRLAGSAALLVPSPAGPGPGPGPADAPPSPSGPPVSGGPGPGDRRGPADGPAPSPAGGPVPSAGWGWDSGTTSSAGDLPEWGDPGPDDPGRETW